MASTNIWGPMAAISPLPHDYVTEWRDELNRVAATAAALSPVARGALIELIDSFAAEDGVLTREVSEARLKLAAGSDRAVRAVSCAGAES
jgi:hypothetical protein